MLVWRCRQHASWSDICHWGRQDQSIICHLLTDSCQSRLVETMIGAPDGQSSKWGAVIGCLSRKRVQEGFILSLLRDTLFLHGVWHSVVNWSSCQLLPVKLLIKVLYSLPVCHTDRSAPSNKGWWRGSILFPHPGLSAAFLCFSSTAAQLLVGSLSCSSAMTC